MIGKKILVYPIRPWEMTEKEFINFATNLLFNPMPEQDDPYTKWLLEMSEEDIREITEIQKELANQERSEHLIKMQNSKTKKEYKKCMDAFLKVKTGGLKQEYNAIIIWARRKGYIN